ncbi:MAG: helix-turn-helix domain-containing protein [Candidatus Marinimicrobia bacterium]|nr:helix-turn-helix domain-containing protein [Candidatus Neomarinimicrobiota bacterium]
MTDRAKYCPCCGDYQERYLTVDSAAKIYDISSAGIRGMLRRREITYYKIGTRTRIAKSDLDNLLVKHSSVREIVPQLDV